MNLDVEDVIDNVTQDFENSVGDIDFTYQNEKWYKAAVTACRTVNLLLCAVLVACFAGGGF